jgi:Sulfatase
MRVRVLSALAVAAVAGAAVIAAVQHDSGEASPRSPLPPARPPVVLLIFDEFPLDDLLGPDGRIDAERYPNFAALARISTWFPNAHTVYDSTFKAVPMIMDSVLPKPGTAADLRSHARSIYTLFAEHGYEVVDAEPGTAVCPPRICAGAPTRRPGVLERLAGGGRPDRLTRWIHQIRRDRPPTLYLQHSLLPHEPWIYLPSGRQSRPSGADPVPGINRPQGFGDPELTKHNEARHVLQAGFVDREVGRLLSRLRDTGQLDDALVVVTADHGYAFEVGTPDRRLVTGSNVDEIAPVPLFVKAPGQGRGRVSESFARNLDIVPTIADLLGWKLDWRHDGRSAFGSGARGRRIVRIPKRDFSRVIRIDAREIQRRRRENRLARNRLYGSGLESRVLFGDPWATLYRTGPHTELLGRPLSRLRVARPGRARARFYDPDVVHRVDGSARVVPVKLAGALTGGGAPREVAISVDGRVRGTGRSFKLTPRQPENFSILVPESALHEGDNDVRAFELRSRGRGVELVPLGRA